MYYRARPPNETFNQIVNSSDQLAPRPDPQRAEADQELQAQERAGGEYMNSVQRFTQRSRNTLESFMLRVNAYAPQLITTTLLDATIYISVSGHGSCPCVVMVRCLT